MVVGFSLFVKENRRHGTSPDQSSVERYDIGEGSNWKPRMLQGLRSIAGVPNGTEIVF